MIPGLFHGRLLAGGPVGGVIAAPDYLPLNAVKNAAGSASATVIFTLQPNGTWASSGTNYTDESGSWYDPTTVGAGAAYEAKITLTLLSGGGGVITNAASDWIGMAAARQLQVALSRYSTGTSSVRYNVQVQIRLTGGAVVSTGNFTLGVDLTVSVSGGGGGCVAIDQWLEPGLQAGDIQISQEIDCANYNPDAIVRLPVLANDISLQPCWRIVTESGAAVIASDSTPMTLIDAGTAYMPDMLGRKALMKDKQGLRWESVVRCYAVGVRLVVKINVSDSCYFAGESADARIATHNTNLKN